MDGQGIDFRKHPAQDQPRAFLETEGKRRSEQGAAPLLKEHEIVRDEFETAVHQGGAKRRLAAPGGPRQQHASPVPEDGAGVKSDGMAGAIKQTMHQAALYHRHEFTRAKAMAEDHSVAENRPPLFIGSQIDREIDLPGRLPDQLLQR